MSTYSDFVLNLSPLVYWRLGASGGTDLSGNGRNGTGAGGITIGGNASLLAAETDAATNFDGSDDKITSSYNPFASGSTRTFCVWINRDASTDQDTIMSDAGGSSHNIWRLASGSGDVLWAPDWAGAGITWAGAYPGNGQSALLALEYNDTTLKARLYVNGVDKGELTNDRDYGTTMGNLQLGCVAASSDPFDGKMDEFFVVDGVLTPAQHANLYSLGTTGALVPQPKAKKPVSYGELVRSTPGLVSYWRFGEQVGFPVAMDLKGNNLGTYTGGFTLEQPGLLPNSPNKSVLLNGTTGYVTVPDHASLDFGDMFTFEIWVKLTLGAVGNLFHKGTNGPIVNVQADGRVVLRKSGVADLVQSTIVLQAGTPHHIVVTKSGATSKIYIDGVDRTGTVTNQTMSSTASPLRIGADQTPANFVNGIIDEAAVYNVDLSAADVAEHYAARLLAPRIDVVRSGSRSSWLAAEITGDDGAKTRYGPDEELSTRRPKQIEFETQIPGGFDAGSFVISRPPNLENDDKLLNSDVRIYGPGDRTAYEGRVAKVSQVGRDEVRLELEGWVNHLDDDEAFREIYQDVDFGHWTGASVQRRIDLASSWNMGDPSIAPDETTGFPSLKLDASPPWSAAGVPHLSAYYSGAGLPIAQLRWAWKTQIMGTNWSVEARLADNDRSSVTNGTGDTHTAGPPNSNSGTLSTSGVVKKFCEVVAFWTAGAVAAGVDDNRALELFWTSLAVRGAHGLTLRGTPTSTYPGGYWGSDIIAHALTAAAPMLAFTTGAGGSIEQSVTEIAHLVYLDETTVREVVENVTALGSNGIVLHDWGVYDEKEFFWKQPGTYGKTWRVRRDQVATPTSAGPSADARAAGYVVTYQDSSGKRSSVGYPGSGADYETALLEDTNPNNPAVKVGAYKSKDIGLVPTQNGAVLAGQMLLAEANRVSWAGSTTIEGEAVDSAGNPYPVHAVRAGDRLVIEDDPDVGEPAINSTAYSHDDETITAESGPPPVSAENLISQLASAAGIVNG